MERSSSPMGQMARPHGIENAAENRNWIQMLYLFKRIYGICSHTFGVQTLLTRLRVYYCTRRVKLVCSRGETEYSPNLIDGILRLQAYFY